MPGNIQGRGSSGHGHGNKAGEEGGATSKVKIVPESVRIGIVYRYLSDLSNLLRSFELTPETDFLKRRLSYMSGNGSPNPNP